MGTRRPQSLAFSDFAREVETVAQMIERRWRVRAYCATCQKTFKVSLRVIAAIKGPTYSLWDKRAPCKLYSCAGRVQFEAIAQRTHRLWTELTSANRVGVLCGGPPPRRLLVDPERLRDDPHPCGWL